jgi:hypothetical protein
MDHTERDYGSVISRQDQGWLSQPSSSRNSMRLRKPPPQFGVDAHAAHVNLAEGKAFCFMSGPDREVVRQAHEAPQH